MTPPTPQEIQAAREWFEHAQKSHYDCAEIKTIRHLLTQQTQGWMGIESAPEETKVLLYCPLGKEIDCAVVWEKDRTMYTNWQPLPPPPTPKDNRT